MAGREVVAAAERGKEEGRVEGVLETVEAALWALADRLRKPRSEVLTMLLQRNPAIAQDSISSSLVVDQVKSEQPPSRMGTGRTDWGADRGGTGARGAAGESGGAARAWPGSDKRPGPVASGHGGVGGFGRGVSSRWSQQPEKKSLPDRPVCDLDYALGESKDAMGDAGIHGINPPSTNYDCDIENALMGVGSWSVDVTGNEEEKVLPPACRAFRDAVLQGGVRDRVWNVKSVERDGGIFVVRAEKHNKPVFMRDGDLRQMEEVDRSSLVMGKPYALRFEGKWHRVLLEGVTTGKQGLTGVARLVDDGRKVPFPLPRTGKLQNLRPLPAEAGIKQRRSLRVVLGEEVKKELGDWAAPKRLAALANFGPFLMDIAEDQMMEEEWRWSVVKMVGVSPTRDLKDVVKEAETEYGEFDWDDGETIKDSDLGEWDDGATSVADSDALDLDFFHSPSSTSASTQNGSQKRSMGF